MGYDTYFRGEFQIHPKLDLQTFQDLASLVDLDRGAEGSPDSSCDWEPTANGMGLRHNGSEKSYNYQEWVQYIVNFLAAREHQLFGEVKYQGEDPDDFGKLIVGEDGTVKKFLGKRVYTTEESFTEEK